MPKQLVKSKTEVVRDEDLTHTIFYVRDVTSIQLSVFTLYDSSDTPR